jgi:catechol 2,3-dioxygenase-like lactoylglutathione lyase family enzyme
MEDRVSKLLNDFDRGRVSRRQLLQAIGIAAATASMPRITFAQGSCGGDRAGTPACNTTPMKPPFEPTGWKTVLLDHFKLQVAELDKEAAYYQALMGWKVRSNDGKKIVLDIGNLGSVVMRGGLPFPPPTPTTSQTPLGTLAASAQALATTAAAMAAAEAARGGNSAGGRGAGGNAGARGGGGGRGNAQRRAIWDGFCFGIEPWDTAKVESELKKRGLNPVADHNAKEEFYSFHVKDPDGFDLQVSNGNKKNRRITPANAELNMAPPFESTGWQTVYLDHISFEVTSYKESVAFYKALLGWIPGGDEGSQDETKINPEIGGLIIRGGNATAPGFAMPAQRRAQMGHIAFGIANFEPDKVLAELQKRGLSARADTGGRDDIHTAKYKSYHTTTPNGFDLQISNVISASS